MNTTCKMCPAHNSSVIVHHFWFIPIDFLTSVCISISSILALFFFLILVFDKTCRNTPMLLVANSYLIGSISGLLALSLNIFRLFNDLYRRTDYDRFCSFRGYMGYSVYTILNFSFFLQALYRFLRIVYPHELRFQTAKFQFILMGSTWIFGIFFPMIFLFTKEIVYDVYNQICALRLFFSFSVIYAIIFAYLMPVSLTMIMYFKLVFYVKKMNRHVTPINTLIRANRDLKMLRRIIILVSILIIYCSPIAIFLFCSLFVQLPKYHLRITLLLIDTSHLIIILTLFQFTDPLKISVKKLFRLSINEMTNTDI